MTKKDHLITIYPLMFRHSFQSRRRSQLAAFTLIELLIVIAIISLLAAILFPVFGRARENARRSSCQSNLKQIGIGILQYTQDYDEILPPSTSNGIFVEANPDAGQLVGNYLNNVPWHFLIQPYVKSYQVFACPSNTQKKSNGNAKVVTKSYSHIPTSYVCRGGDAINERWGGVAPMNRSAYIPGSGFAQAADPVEAGGRKLSQLTYVATTILVGENAGESGEPEFNAFSDFDTVDTAPVKFTNHLGTSNFLFADGHVKAMKPIATITPINMWNITNTGTATKKSNSAGNYTDVANLTPGPATDSTLKTKFAAQQAAMG